MELTVRASVSPRQIIVVATGTEVATAIAAADQFEAQSIGVDVVSMPSWPHFDPQSDAYRAALLPQNVMTVSVEAARCSVGRNRLDAMAFQSASTVSAYRLRRKMLPGISASIPTR